MLAFTCVFGPWQLLYRSKLQRHSWHIVLFTFAKVDMIWFNTLVPDKSLALLDVLHINQVSDKTFG